MPSHDPFFFSSSSNSSLDIQSIVLHTAVFAYDKELERDQTVMSFSCQAYTSRVH